ncbi:histidine phosphatase family protein [Microbacterium azadirachtae]|uniref:Phosphoserine phosphatase 1 n=1 Tax=Microbacterium azadirachtae TaxID=582680 RepID=A0A0F0LFK9_9MICO|nr:histidine phosphatase family protein [Microbacterium azadirachtae]KJL31918.1 Phosphoserine phosphatase 1 [Microbacterium azadirachtae]
MSRHDLRMPERLFLARHGQTAWNREHRLQGQLDSPLTEAGIGHANEIARRLEGAGVGIVCTSPLGRARRTAEIVAAHLDVEVVAVDELAEVHHGSFAGRTWDELEEASPGIRALRSENRYGWAFPGGESYASARPRALRALDECSWAGEGTPLIVAHEMIGRLLRAAMRGFSHAEALALRHPHGIVFEITRGAERLV